MRRSLTLAAFLALMPAAWAHMPILVSDRPMVERGETVTLDYGFGHPFEAEVAPAAEPERLLVHPPAGDAVDVTGQLAATGSEGARGWRVQYTPQVRGDHVVALEAAPVEHGGRTFRDFVKLVLHVSAVQQGWDRAVGHPLELVPLTRPYGIKVGAVFRARLLADGAPLAGAPVEVEARNLTAPQELPPEPFVTGLEKTGAAGEVAVVLDRAGWWVLAASQEGEAEERRACLWVHVGR